MILSQDDRFTSQWEPADFSNLFWYSGWTAFVEIPHPSEEEQVEPIPDYSFPLFGFTATTQ